MDSVLKKILDNNLTEPGCVAIVYDKLKYIYNNKYSLNHRYEIGSLTKLFTAELLASAAMQNIVDLNAPLNTYLEVRKNSYSPSILQILTHHSGFLRDYFELIPIIKCILKKDAYVVNSRNVIKKRLLKIKLNSSESGYNYSNFGYAVLGLVLEQVYGTRYDLILRKYLDDHSLSNTGINIQQGKDYWCWNMDDAYIAAGGLISTLEDMISFAQIILRQDKSLATRRFKHKPFSKDCDFDYIGMSWRIREDGTCFHTGLTANFNSYISINKDSNSAVLVLLSNDKNKVQCQKSAIIAKSIEAILKKF